MSTHLLRRGNRYYLRRRIPKDLVLVYNKSEIVKSLGTSTRSVAVVLLRKANVLVDEEFESKRQDSLSHTALNTSIDALCLPNKLEPLTPKKTLRDLYVLWEGKRVRPIKTKSEYKLVASRFGWEREVKYIDKASCTDFRDNLKSKKLSVTTINKSLTILVTLLNIGIEYGYIADNSATNLALPQETIAKERRYPFDEDSLLKVFNAPVNRGGLTKGGGGIAGYWLPILALYTGARLEELAQLTPDNVKRCAYMDDGIENYAWMIHITDEGAEQTLKNRGSKRWIPVHQDLIALNFIDFTNSKKSCKRIFNELHPDVYGKISGNWSKWFGRYLRTECKVLDTKIVFHSFRHTFKDYCRNSNIDESIHDAITGHSSNSTARNYGSLNYPMQPLIKAMAAYKVPEKIREAIGLK
ncbi:site-specific integrase [Hafnia alvei]|uniref:site-specific integrase n=1 Tax=Hafnia alvei TaxID=569 RepID=UPI000C9F6A0F|nr:site-specific integrase [Hafnia alvei]MBI0275454.1 site-specific integrase [Hafnia alvei]PNK98550.1 hypothetical protein CEQ28_013630 [Hafnia alvei]